MPLHKSLVTAACRWFQPPITSIEHSPNGSSMSSTTVYSSSTTSNGSRPQSAPVKNSSSSLSSAPRSLHVNFQSENPELSDRKKKYLTAKYGQHQMSLIKKRLRVEMWMYEQLQGLYCVEENPDNSDLEIDLDELMDIEDESTRKEWLNKKVSNAKKSRDCVDKFVEELLERAKTL